MAATAAQLIGTAPGGLAAQIYPELMAHVDIVLHAVPESARAALARQLVVYFALDPASAKAIAAGAPLILIDQLELFEAAPLMVVLSGLTRAGGELAVSPPDPSLARVSWPKRPRVLRREIKDHVADFAWPVQLPSGPTTLGQLLTDELASCLPASRSGGDSGSRGAIETSFLADAAQAIGLLPDDSMPGQPAPGTPSSLSDSFFGRAIGSLDALPDDGFSSAPTAATVAAVTMHEVLLFPITDPSRQERAAAVLAACGLDPAEAKMRACKRIPAVAMSFAQRAQADDCAARLSKLGAMVKVRTKD